jgi:hypothetical protein
MLNDKRFKGNPEFPIEEPQLIAGGATSNDTDIIYCVDTGGVDAVLAAGMQQIDVDGNKSASGLAGATFNGVLYGRWTNVGADVQLLCYRQIPINSAT